MSGRRDPAVLAAKAAAEMASEVQRAFSSKCKTHDNEYTTEDGDGSLWKTMEKNYANVQKLQRGGDEESESECLQKLSEAEISIRMGWYLMHRPKEANKALKMLETTAESKVNGAA